MALSDPFESTLRAGQVNQARTDQIQQNFGQFGQQMAQGQQTQNLLKQFGILKEKEQPYSIDEIKDIAEKKFGTKINISSTLTPEKQSETAQKLLTSMGIKLPKRTTPEIDLDQAQKLGMTYKPNMFGGEVTFQPKKPEKTLLEQITEADIAKEKGYDYGAGKIKTKGTGGIGAAQLAYAERNASTFADAVEQGDFGALGVLGKQSLAPIVVELRNRGMEVTEPMLAYKAEQSTMGNAKIQDQKVNNAISAQTLLDSSFDEKSGEYKVPPSMHVELALSVARMLSQTGVVPYDMVQELRQATAREGLTGAAIWMGFDPKEVGGSTQSVINLFAKTIEREGLASEKMRDKYRQGGVSSFKEFKQAGRNVTDTAGITTPSKFKSGDIREKNGKKYQRNESGQWLQL